MKHLYFLCLLAMLDSMQVSSQPGQWSYMCPNPYYIGGTSSYSDITFCDSLHGFALDGGNPRMMKTTDGGSSWYWVNTPSPSFIIQFISPQTGWISDGYSVWRTTDGGNNWMHQLDTTNIGFPHAFITSINFLDSLIGFVTGEYYVGKTTDGGNTWRNITPMNIDSLWWTLSFLNADTGWALSSDSTIAKTTDGGETWTKQIVHDLPDPLCALHFYNARYGLAFVPSGQVMKSIDGGVNWTVSIANVSVNIANVKYGNSGLIYFHDLNTGNNYMSTDSGNTFRTVSVPVGIFVSYFNNPLSGYTAYQSIYKTVNGGVTWTSDIPQYPAAPYPIADFGRRSSTDLVAVRPGYNFKSADNGVNWIQDQDGYLGNIIQTISLSCYFENGYNGIYRFENGAVTYSNSNYNFIYAQSKDSFIVSDFAHPDTMLLLKTTDGGGTWQTIFTFTDPNNFGTVTGEWKTLDFMDNLRQFAVFQNWNTGIVALDDRHVFVTTNGGQTWAQPANNVQDVYYFTARISPQGDLYALCSYDYGVSTAWFKWNTLSLRWQFISYMSGTMISGNSALPDIGWSPDGILWCSSSPDGSAFHMQYSFDNGYTWSQYPLLTDGITMMKTMPDGSFIGGTDIGALLQYNATVSNCRIKGNVFYDFNRNGVFDSIDVEAAGYPVYIQPQHLLIYTDANGDYLTAVDSGSHIIQPSAIFNYQAMPGNRPVNFSAHTGESAGNNFALQPIDSMLNDLSLSVIEDGEVNPGFNHVTYINYINNGVQPAQPVVVFMLDPQLTYISAVPPATSQHGDSLIWNLSLLNPLQHGNIIVTTGISISAQLEQIIQNVGMITPIGGDYTPNDNTDTSYFYVMGSYDPNFKTVKPGTLAGNQTTTSQQLTYTIHFQNTGTDSTHFVVVKDALADGLNVGSIRVLASSAPCSVHIAAGNVVEFIFDDYSLPDSGTSQAASRGFVSFAIEPNTDWLDMDTIYNIADIYFDYNQPVTTNTAKVKVSDPGTEVHSLSGKLNISVYPNPSSYIIHICSDKGFKATLFDLSGKPLMETETDGTRNSLSVNGLSAGMYLLQIIQNGQMQCFSVAVIRP